MFDLDLSKILLCGVVALAVIGPKELPAALRAAGRAMAQLRRIRGEAQKALGAFMADASLDREIAEISAARVNLAANPMTAMRGGLAASEAKVAEAAASEYSSPEMQAYLAPPPEAG